MPTPTTAAQTPRRNARGEGVKLRADLIDAAWGQLADDPVLEHLSVRVVTRRVGVTATAMYLHFPDRETLLEAVKERGFSELTRRITAPDRAAADPVERLRMAGRAYLRYAAENVGVYALMFHGETESTDASDRVKDIGLAAFGELTALVAACRSGWAAGAPEPDPANPATRAATALWLSWHGRATIRRTMPWFSMIDDAAFVADQVAATLLAD